MEGQCVRYTSVVKFITETSPLSPQSQLSLVQEDKPIVSTQGYMSGNFQCITAETVYKSRDDGVIFFFFKRYCLLMRNTERERQTHRQKEKQAPRGGEPDAGLDPRTPDHALS